jgi:hypothetical protein
MYETKAAAASAMTGARRKTVFVALLASSAMALAVTPAHADKRDRAHEAIAAAEAKIHTAETIGGATAAPSATAEARAALATAKENLASGHKSTSIEAAIRASALADTVIGEAQRNKDDTVAAAQDAQRQGVSTAQQQAATAQDQAAEANARADAAQQSAASSAADAAAARNAAALAAQTPPAQVETTVTTQQPSGAHRSTRTKVTRRATSPAPAPSSEVTTTTKVNP